MKTGLYVLGGLLGLVLIALVGGFIYLSTLDFNSFKPMIAAEVEKATGRTLSIQDDIALEISLTPSLAVSGVSLSNPEGAAQPNMIVLDKAEAQVDLWPLLMSGTIKIQQFTLRDVTVYLERDAKGQANWVFSGVQDQAAQAETPAPSEAAGPVSLPTIDALLLENIQVFYTDATSSTQQQIILDRLAGRLVEGQTELALEAMVNGEAVALEATVADLEQLLAAGTTAVAAQIEAAGARATAAGDASLEAVNLAVTLKGDTISDFSTLLGTELPSSPAYDVAARVAYAADRIDVSDLVTQVGQSDLSGTVSVMLAGERPRVQARLGSNKLDLDQLTGNEGADSGADSRGTQQADAPSDGRVIPQTPLPVVAIKDVDLDVQVTAGEVRSGEVMLTDLGLNVQNKNGVLSLRPVKTGLLDGQVTTNITVDGRQAVGQYDTDVTVEQIELGGLLALLGVDGDAMQGALGGAVDLTSRGQTVREVLGNLTGQLSFLSTDGTIGQGYLNLLAGDLISQLPLLATGEDETKLNCIIAAFDVTDGLATARTVVMDTERMTVRVEGDINLKTEELDLKISPKAKDEGLSLATAIRVGGTFADPSINPDAADVAGKALGLAAGLATGGAAGLLVPFTTAGSGAEDACAEALATPASGTGSGHQAQPQQTQESQPQEPSLVPKPEQLIEGLKGLFGR